jgi:alanine dehydrogenase
MTVILDKPTVESLLDLPDCIDAVERAQVMISLGEVVMPLRMTVQVPACQAELNLMPAWTGADGAFGYKGVTFFPGNPTRGLPAVGALVVLMEPETGLPLAIMDGASITAMRTAAASAVATRVLAQPHARILALVGAGVQARSHLEAMRAVRPIETVRVVSLKLEETEAFVARAREEHPDLDIQGVGTPREAIRDAELVCTVTWSAEPVVNCSWLSPGCHINAVGSHTPTAREIDGETMRRARVIVDSREANLAECGDCLIPIREGLFGPEHVSDEIGEVLTGAKPGRTSSTEITVFQSCGLAAQDVAAAKQVFDKACAAGLGQLVQL